MFTFQLRKSPEYFKYYNLWSKLILVELFPYLAMGVLNFLIWRRVIFLVRARNQCGVEPGTQSVSLNSESCILN